ncbi:Hypothetical Protein FCC1311_095292 [Hondaea fermentalgiana]|uniref:Uncharacterized protein n=1 Tax=Hondaea fermentalgiana TaxID=2315210 RepID=A0A2R5GRT2_9STRA|nr:Hypothetical Protein FCC1311_095292 [Hondaea fermentalgiana]|eukprot:GBG33305.1 Hypothetical Protein FCC1311_095292 [Hondaea fermentalgiana]
MAPPSPRETAVAAAAGPAMALDAYEGYATAERPWAGPGASARETRYQDKHEHQQDWRQQLEKELHLEIKLEDNVEHDKEFLELDVDAVYAYIEQGTLAHKDTGTSVDSSHERVLVGAEEYYSFADHEISISSDGLDQDLFLKRIAVLEQEIETLRFAGNVDLDQENRLLREQIRRHTEFIRTFFLPAAEKAEMLERGNHERAMALQGGISSCIEQIIGLIHTSTCWEKTLGFRLDQGMNVDLRQQRLPYGPVSACKRWNLRSEALHVPMPAKAMSAQLWKHLARERPFQHVKSMCRPGVTRDIEVLTSHMNADVLAELDADVEILRFLESEAGICKETCLIVTRQTKSLYPQTFILSPQVQGAFEEAVPVKCYIVALHGGTEGFRHLQRAPNLDRMQSTEARDDSSLVLGTVIIEDPNDSSTCHVIMAVSQPIGMVTSFGSVNEIFAADGSIHPEQLELQRQKQSYLFRGCGVPNLAP